MTDPQSPAPISSPTHFPAGIGYPTFHWVTQFNKGTSGRLSAGVGVRDASRTLLISSYIMWIGVIHFASSLPFAPMLIIVYYIIM